MIVDSAVYAGGQRLDSSPNLDEALQAGLGSGAFVWIGLHEPTAEEFEDVKRAFHLHELAVEDAIKAHQRPKLEVYGNTLFIVLKPVRYIDPDRLCEAGEVLLFVGTDFVVSVRHGAAGTLSGVRRAIEARPELLKLGPAAILYGILDKVVDDYRAAVAEIEGLVQEVEAGVLEPGGGGSPERIYTLKRAVLELNMATSPLLDPLERLQTGRVGSLGSGLTDYLRDVYDHLLKVVQDLHRFRELLSNAMDLYLSAASTRLNVSMKQLTLIASLFLPLTFLTGFFGMNFGLLVSNIGTPLSFVACLVLMACSVVAQLIIFKRRGLLDSR